MPERRRQAAEDPSTIDDDVAHARRMGRWPEHAPQGAIIDAAVKVLGGGA